MKTNLTKAEKPFKFQKYFKEVSSNTCKSSLVKILRCGIVCYFVYKPMSHYNQKEIQLCVLWF